MPTKEKYSAASTTIGLLFRRHHGGAERIDYIGRGWPCRLQIGASTSSWMVNLDMLFMNMVGEHAHEYVYMDDVSGAGFNFLDRQQQQEDALHGEEYALEENMLFVGVAAVRRGHVYCFSRFVMAALFNGSTGWLVDWLELLLHQLVSLQKQKT
ncbi:hypothetical protein Mgra_00001213 [Meloidogyne graminicola]|uniref:Uncharacterized protein n=1 Tax=Meloidogyne graminicola TaxID=189291 RepID=A0A8S9ZZU4_9BILA|nr:hypothetical protein Mgra_00001213 [Meloidogyne graminicola]